MPTPMDMLNYAKEKGYESSFLASVALHKHNYSIAEIAEKRFKEKDGVYKFISKPFSINVEIEDKNIIEAIENGMYITPFISRKDDTYQVHFLVHQYPEMLRPQFEELIAQEVVEYMMLKTIIALRLDSELKIDNYVKV